MGKGSNSPGKLGRCITAPFRVLRRARDLYVNCLTGCAGTVRSTGMAAMVSRRKGYGFQHPASTATEDDIRELIRAAARSTVHPAGATRPSQAQKDGAVPRCSSVATIGTIDEDQPCDFEEEGEVKVGTGVEYPRSRSCAVAATKRVGALAA